MLTWNVSETTHFLEREPKPVKINGNAPIHVSGLWSRACIITWEAICYLTLYSEKTVKNAVCGVLSWPPDFTEGMLTSIKAFCSGPIILSHILIKKQCEITLGRNWHYFQCLKYHLMGLELYEVCYHKSDHYFLSWFLITEALKYTFLNHFLKLHFIH